VLYERLADLRAAGLVVQGEHGRYALTALGRQLGDAITPLQRWAARWSTAQRGRTR
jgi:DNA-binding HxlR family transcriptional regulator